LINTHAGAYKAADCRPIIAEVLYIGKPSTGDIGMEIKLNVKNGWVVLPASLKSPDGQPRFHLTFPSEFTTDAGANYLVSNEVKHGYELPTRNFLEKLLRPGDLFVDVGAHWGFFTLQAATHPAGGVRVIAFEPDPTNASILYRNASNHRLTNKIAVICAACGDVVEIAPLVTNSTMMHSIRGIGLKPPFARGPSKWVPIVTLDHALSKFPELTNTRIILKVDAEGFEPQVIDGAQSILHGGKVAVVIWECGHAFANGPERRAMQRMVDTLSNLGFRHRRPPSQEPDGPFAPFDVNQSYHGNVISCRGDLAI
jgi:FkbM family methyltransferase